MNVCVVRWSVRGFSYVFDLLFCRENVGGGCIGLGGFVVKYLIVEVWDLGLVYIKFFFLNYSLRG